MNIIKLRGLAHLLMLIVSLHMISYLFYITGTAYSFLHVLLIGLQDISNALHQLLDLGGQTLRRWLLQNFPDKLLRVSVALIVHHGGGPRSAGHPAATVAPSQCDVALGVGSQRGLRCLGGRICGARKGSGGSITAALYCRRHGRENEMVVLRSSIKITSFRDTKHITTRIMK